MPSEQNILKGRQAVDEYRTAHTTLHKKKWHKGIPDEHTPLFEMAIKELEKQDFNSLDAFSKASRKLNIQEHGFKNEQDFEETATKADKEALSRMWH